MCVFFEPSMRLRQGYPYMYSQDMVPNDMVPNEILKGVYETAMTKKLIWNWKAGTLSEMR